jgi:hypothetical protein
MRLLGRRVEFRSPQLSELVWATGMGRCLEEGIDLPPGLVWAGLNTKWRVYKYGEGQGFGPHFDEGEQLLCVCVCVRRGREGEWYVCVM